MKGAVHVTTDEQTARHRYNLFEKIPEFVEKESWRLRRPIDGNEVDAACVGSQVYDGHLERRVFG